MVVQHIPPPPQPPRRWDLPFRVLLMVDRARALALADGLLVNPPRVGPLNVITVSSLPTGASADHGDVPECQVQR